MAPQEKERHQWLLNKPSISANIIKLRALRSFAGINGPICWYKFLTARTRNCFPSDRCIGGSKPPGEGEGDPKNEVVEGSAVAPKIQLLQKYSQSGDWVGRECIPVARLLRGLSRLIHHSLIPLNLARGLLGPTLPGSEPIKYPPVCVTVGDFKSTRSWSKNWCLEVREWKLVFLYITGCDLLGSFFVYFTNNQSKEHRSFYRV